MPKTSRKKPTTRKPQQPATLKIYQLAFGVKLTTAAFRRQDAVQQAKRVFEALAETLNAAGGGTLQVDPPKLLVTKELGVLDLEP